MNYKSFEIKAQEDKGTIEGYFSTYDRIPDSYGDVVAPGAFTETIKAREASGHPFPLCWNHDLDQIIGAVDSITDNDHGPYMVAHFFDTPLAQEKREIVKSGVVYQFSFAYSVEDEAVVELADGTKANELRKLNLYEVSVVPIPANPRAEVTNIKSNEELVKNAISALQALLHTDEGEDEAKANVAAEEPKQSNPEKEDLLAYIKSMEANNEPEN